MTPIQLPSLGWVIFLCAFLVTGCATQPLQTDQLLKSPAAQQPPVELTAVPFFPQEAFQCGPAALATVLNWSGTQLTPESLAPQVYLPGRQGSLQVELLTATRRHGRIPYVLRPEMETLINEVRAGHPVLVLQNLAFNWYPKWHYAVVVGFDLQDDQIILRSGREQRQVLPIKLFERTWRRSGYWAITVTTPDDVPLSAEEISYLQAVAPLERLQRWEDAKTAYTAALTRWPNSITALMGLGNSRYALHDVHGAEAAYRHVTQQDANFAPAYNNLAQTLADQNQLDAAEQAARHAVSLGGPLLTTYQDTLQQIIAQQKAAP